MPLIKETAMESDDRIRSSNGVVCCLREIGDGNLRLVLDDVTNDKKDTSGHWEHDAVFTWKDFDENEITNLSVSNEVLADFGLNILTRLVARRKHGAA